MNSDDRLPFIIFLTPISCDGSNRLWRQRLLPSPCSLWRHKQTLVGVIRPLADGKCRRFRRVTERYRFHRYLCFHCIYCVRVFCILFCTTRVTISYQNCIHSNSTLITRHTVPVVNSKGSVDVVSVTSFKFSYCYCTYVHPSEVNVLSSFLWLKQHVYHYYCNFYRISSVTITNWDRKVQLEMARLGKLHLKVRTMTKVCINHAYSVVSPKFKSRSKLHGGGHREQLRKVKADKVKVDLAAFKTCCWEISCIRQGGYRWLFCRHIHGNGKYTNHHSYIDHSRLTFSFFVICMSQIFSSVSTMLVSVDTLAYSFVCSKGFWAQLLWVCTQNTNLRGVFGSLRVSTFWWNMSLIRYTNAWNKIICSNSPLLLIIDFLLT